MQRAIVVCFGGLHILSKQTLPLTRCDRLSFLRQWLAKFKGVSKHQLQEYLNLLSLLLNDNTDWFSTILSYKSSR